MDKRSVFVLGDSVSIHYGPYLKEMIKNKYNYDRKRGLNHALKDLDNPLGANAGDSKMVLDYLVKEKSNKRRYDLLLINCGLHDIRVDRYSGDIQINLDEYKKNLLQIISISKEIANFVVWIGLTPIVDKIHNSREEGFLRYEKDAFEYNNTAKELMKSNNISVIDMYNFVKSLGQDIYSDHVHFKEEVRKLQAAFIAGYILNQG